MRLFNVKRWFINIYHPRIFWISMFIVLINVRVLPGKNMFESSANGILNNREDTRDKSFIYSKNKSGPNMEPCDTPQRMYCNSDGT